jgi:hypothetical protein
MACVKRSDEGCARDGTSGCPRVRRMVLCMFSVAWKYLTSNCKVLYLVSPGFRRRNEIL